MRLITRNKFLTTIGKVGAGLSLMSFANDKPLKSQKNMKRNVGIFIFDDSEVLDFAGPFEVFSVTSQLNNYEPFEVFTVAKSKHPVTAVNGLSINPDYDFKSHPTIDFLIVAGGQGTRNVLQDAAILQWIGKVHATTQITASICSGARLLGKLGLLNEKPFCTHHGVYEHMKELVPSAIPQPDKRFVQSSEKVYTSGGISAGIDLSFHLIEKMLGKETAKATAQYMEYSISI
jgi:transcriptional regulator GlxA family with amidase domain